MAALPIQAPAQLLPRLLWVDDSRMLLSLYQSVFESLGFEVLATSSPNEALEHLSSHGADVAILDYDMPEIDGGALASMIKDQCPMLPVILYSGNPSIPYVARRWVDAVCAKAAPRAELLATIDRLSQNAQREENNRLRTFTPSSNH
jgi:DNA-binding NtrC family response regulator